MSQPKHAIAIRGLCPLVQVFDMPTSLRFYAEPPKVAPYGMKQLYATDPDGYVLCFQWPEPAAQQRETQD